VSDNEEPAKPEINSQQWTGNLYLARGYEPYRAVTTPVMPARLGLLLIFFGVLAIGVMILQVGTGKAYPACDNSVARATLKKLYDNRRLLQAVDVRALRLLSDGLKGRYCTAMVKWGNGSETEVHYEFYRAGRQNEYLSMWIDYNGGMRGPSL
jgi:hypothetical protein